ncbi:MAG: hypothetical protein H0X25_03075 [Acidobacteriales bacterium]|nr:hypothetical protein [Terriglobales bacterium]
MAQDEPWCQHYRLLSAGELPRDAGATGIGTEYIYLNGQRIAKMPTGTNVDRYYLSDHLGSTSVMAMGCTRGQNEDVINLGNSITQFQQSNPGVVIPYVRE